MLRIRDVYPGSWFLSIPDPGSKNSNKRERGKNCCPTFSCSYKYHKIETYFIFELVKKKKLGQFTKQLEILTQKIVIKLSGLGSVYNIQDPVYGKNLFQIPDPGVKKAPDPGSGSATLLWALVVCGCVCVCQPLPTQTRLPLTMLFCPEYLVNTYSTK